MATKDNLRKIFEAGYPLVEQWLDAAEQIAALREVATEAGLDWSQIKSLLKAKVQDDRDDSGTTKRITRIVDKAESASAYADMLGLAKVNENIFSAAEPFDPETGEIIEPNTPREEGVAHAEEAAPVTRAVNAAPTRAPDMEIPAFLRRTKPPPELVE